CTKTSEPPPSGAMRDQFSHGSANAIGIACRPASFDADVAAMSPTELCQSLQESRVAGLTFRIVRGRGVQHTDPPRRARLLRARRRRPRSRAAECSQQLPPSDDDCHTPLPCEVRKGTIPRHERAVFTFKEGRMHHSSRHDLANAAIAAWRLAVRGRAVFVASVLYPRRPTGTVALS